MTKILDHNLLTMSQAQYALTDIVPTLTSNRTLFDSAGLLVHAPHNLVENAFLRDRTSSIPSGYFGTVSGSGTAVYTTIDDYEEVVFNSDDGTSRAYINNQLVTVADTTYTGFVYIKNSAMDVAALKIVTFDATSGTDGTITDAQWTSLGGEAGWCAVGFTMGSDTNVTMRMGVGTTGVAKGTVTMSRPGIVRGLLPGVGVNAPAKIDEPFLTQGGWVGTTDGGEPAYKPRLASHIYSGSSWVNVGLGDWQAYTNLSLQSEDFETTWVNSGGVAITANSTIGPDGVQTADTLDDQDGSGSDRMEQSITVVDDSLDHTYYFYVKKTSSDSHRMGISLVYSGGTGKRNDYTVNTNDGTMTARSVGGQADDGHDAALEGDYYRVHVTSTNNNTGNTTLKFSIFPAIATSDTGSWVNSVTGSKIVTANMLTKSSVPLPYISTTTAAVSVSADVHKQLVSTISGFSQSTISVYADFYISQLQSTGLRNIINLDDGGITDQISLSIQSGGGGNDLEWKSTHSADTDGSVVNTNAISAGTSYKSILGFQDDDFTTDLDGAVVVQDATAALPLGDDLISVDFGSDSAGNHLNGYLSRLILWNTRLPNSQLVTLTTFGPGSSSPLALLGLG